MYTHIIDPSTNKSVLVTSKKGKQIIRKYISYLNGGGKNNKLSQLRKELVQLQKKIHEIKNTIRKEEKEVNLMRLQRGGAAKTTGDIMSQLVERGFEFPYSGEEPSMSIMDKADDAGILTDEFDSEMDYELSMEANIIKHFLANKYVIFADSETGVEHRGFVPSTQMDEQYWFYKIPTDDNPDTKAPLREYIEWIDFTGPNKWGYKIVTDSEEINSIRRAVIRIGECHTDLP